MTPPWVPTSIIWYKRPLQSFISKHKHPSSTFVYFWVISSGGNVWILYKHRLKAMFWVPTMCLLHVLVAIPGPVERISWTSVAISHRAREWPYLVRVRLTKPDVILQWLFSGKASLLTMRTTVILFRQLLVGGHMCFETFSSGKQLLTTLPWAELGFLHYTCGFMSIKAPFWGQFSATIGICTCVPLCSCVGLLVSSQGVSIPKGSFTNLAHLFPFFGSPDIERVRARWHLRRAPTICTSSRRNLSL